jgi:glycosyltransferase involved in cell wall biosynthesis
VRVLRLTPSFAPPPGALSGRGVRFDPVGGLQNHAATLTRELDARGVAQTVLTGALPTAPARERVGERAHVLRLGLPGAGRRRALGPLAAPLALPLARRADLVHVHFSSDLGIVAVGMAAARLARRPLVLTLHTSLRHTLVVDSPVAARLKRRGAPLEGWAERSAAAVIALTPRVARALQAEGIAPERVHAIPSGVDPARFAGPHEDPFPGVPHPRVVFHGRVQAEKGVHTLVEATARLGDDVHVLLVGDGSERPRVEARARELGLAGRLRVTGFLPHDRVPAALAHADVAVLPSVFEELGTAMLEALHGGVPFVASRVGGIPEVVRDGESALLVEPGDPDALAAALERVLRDRELAARLGAAGRERARDFAWPALADRVLEVYRAVTREARTTAP